MIQRVAMTLLAMVLTLASAWADDGINYLFNGTLHNTYTNDHVADSDVGVITNDTKTLDAPGGGTTWYYVSGEVTCYNRIEISGTVNIILVDGCNFTASNGIHVGYNGNLLNIYAQSAGDGCGKLTVMQDGRNAAIGGDGGQNEGYGLNGDDGENSGSISIYGGKITANGNIGGGNGSNAQATEDSECQAGGGGNGYVYIYGGIVTVNGNIGGGNGGTGESYYDYDNYIEHYCGDGSKGDGSVTLSWSNLSDRIYATHYNVEYSGVSLQKDFYDATNQQVISAGNCSVSNLGGKTLQPATKRYVITISNSECLKADKSDASETEEVTLTAINGYTVSSVTVTGNVSVTDNHDGTFTFAMPANAVEVTATASHTHYEIAATENVTLSVDESDKLVQDGTTYYRAGTTIPFSLTAPYENYELQALDVHHTDDQTVITPTQSGSTYSFTMPAADVTISPSWVPASFSISKDSHMSLDISEGGSVTINGNVYYNEGATVTVSITPPDGKYVDGFSVKKSDNSAVEFITNSDGTYTFYMPADNVTLHASYAVPINFTWTLTDEDQDGVDETLTITGTGAMTDFADWRDRPWNYNYENIKTVIISNGITSISNHAFNGCHKLTSVTIPAGVQRIGNWAFHSCSNVGLKSITIPSSVQTIGELAFSGCSYLSSFTIPASVTSIGSDAFWHCFNLSDVYCYADPANLTWSDGGYNDFIYDDGALEGPHEHQVTRCHVFADKLNAFKGKWSTGNENTDVNVEFLGDLGNYIPYIDANGHTQYVKNTFVLTEDEGVTKLVTHAGATDQLVSFTRSGLTANAYSTMCLPFSFNAPSACTFYAFTGIGWNSTNQQWEATITEQNANATLNAHTPYIFKCTKTEATFTGTIATVAASYGDTELSDGAVDATDGTDRNWTFKGTYTALDWTSAAPQEPTYGFSTYVPYNEGNTAGIAAGTFVRFVKGASLAPFRARLIYSGTNSHLRAPIRGSGNSDLPQFIVVRIVNDNGTITYVGTVDTATGEISNDVWFTLEGKMLPGEPTESGIFIYNGQKVSINK